MEKDELNKYRNKLKLIEKLRTDSDKNWWKNIRLTCHKCAYYDLTNLNDLGCQLQNGKKGQFILSFDGEIIEEIEFEDDSNRGNCVEFLRSGKVKNE